MQAIVRASAVGLAAIVLIGCGPSHHHSPYHRLGDPLTLTVEIHDSEVEQYAGTLHYRRDADPEYIAEPMNRRHRALWATVPTEGAAAGTRIDYYFDLTLDGEAVYLRSPGEPYRVTLLSPEAHRRRSLEASVDAEGSDEAIRFTLRSGGYTIGRAEVVYERPDAVGTVRAPMQRRSPNWYELVIDAEDVAPGAWRYTIEAEVEGERYTLPATGRDSFLVEDAE